MLLIKANTWLGITPWSFQMKGDTTSLIHGWQPWRRPPIFLEVAVWVSSPWGQTVQRSVIVQKTTEQLLVIQKSTIHCKLNVLWFTVFTPSHYACIFSCHTHTPSINLHKPSDCLFFSSCSPVLHVSNIFSIHPLYVSKPFQPDVTNAFPQLKLPWYNCAHRFTYPIRILNFWG